MPVNIFSHPKMHCSDGRLNVTSAGHAISQIHTHPLISRIFIFHRAIPIYNSLPLTIRCNNNLPSFRDEIVDYFSQLMLVGNDSLEKNQFIT